VALNRPEKRFLDGEKDVQPDEVEGFS